MSCSRRVCGDVVDGGGVGMVGTGGVVDGVVVGEVAQEVVGEVVGVVSEKVEGEVGEEVGEMVEGLFVVVVGVSGVESLMLKSGLGVLRVVVEEEARPVWSVRVLVVVVVMVDGVVTVVVVSTMCSGGLVLVVDVVVVIDVVMPLADVVVVVVLLVVRYLRWSAWVDVVESVVVVVAEGGWISFARRCHSVLSWAIRHRW